MSIGDHARFNRGLYDHHVVDCGESYIHFDGSPGAKLDASVVEGSPGSLGNSGYSVVQDGGVNGYSHCEAARKELGQEGYNLAVKNCEHYADRATGGPGRSRQVEATAMILTPVIAKLLSETAKNGSVMDGLTAAVETLPKSAATYLTYRAVQNAGVGLARSSANGVAQGVGRGLARANIAAAVAILAVETVCNTGQYLGGKIDGAEFACRTAESGAGVCGGFGGAALGATIGSVVPGFGTAVGAIVGAIFGGLFASKAVDAVLRKPELKRRNEIL